MFELTVIEGPAKGSNVVLKDGRSVTIGSGAQADLRVGGDAADSHVVIKPLKGGGFGAKALAGSVRINGQDLAAARLNSGDLIEAGDSKIRFAPPQASASMPDTLGGFEILGVLGKGGMGVVYRARQVSLDREVALKVLADKHAKDPEFVQRFLDEARHAAQLHHPNVVQVFDVDQADGRYFYSMELMHEGSVERRLKREGRLAIDDSIRITLDAARGLAFAKETGLVHRDIKPDNLMVDRHGNVKLCDLGLARTEDEDEGKIVGTPHFMPPEQIQRKSLDHRSDLYALGCTLFRMVTGETPFSGNNVKEILRGHLKEEPPRADEVADGIPSSLADVIEQLLQKDPEDRYGSAHELVEDLESVSEPAKGGKSGLLIAIAILVLGGIGFAVMGGGDKPDPAPGPAVAQRDPNADAERQRETEQMRLELDAKDALFKLIQEDMPEAERATKLDALAEKFEGTSAASDATERAAGIRRRIADQQAREAARAEAVQQAVQSFEQSFQTALESGDLLQANALVETSGIDADLAGTDAVKNAIQQAATKLVTAADEDWAAGFAAIGRALGANEFAQANEQITALRNRLPGAEGGGWPSRLVGEAKARTSSLDQWAQRVTEAERTAARAATLASWNSARDLAWASDGPINQLRAGRLDLATQAFEAAASSLGDVPAASTFRRMGGLSALGNVYVDRLRNGLGSLTLRTESGPRKLVQLQLEAPMKVELENPDNGEKEFVDAASLRDTAWPEFDAENASKGGPRQAFLSALHFGASLSACRGYLGTIADDMTSGVGTGLLDSVPPRALEFDENAAPEWAAIVNQELQAAQALHQAFRALDSSRNSAAVRRLEKLLAGGDGRLAVELMR